METFLNVAGAVGLLVVFLACVLYAKDKEGGGWAKGKQGSGWFESYVLGSLYFAGVFMVGYAAWNLAGIIFRFIQRGLGLEA